MSSIISTSISEAFFPWPHFHFQPCLSLSSQQSREKGMMHLPLALATERCTGTETPLGLLSRCTSGRPDWLVLGLCCVVSGCASQLTRSFACLLALDKSPRFPHHSFHMLSDASSWLTCLHSQRRLRRIESTPTALSDHKGHSWARHNTCFSPDPRPPAS